ncbi:MAG: rRNA (uracil1498-N3)-methyltransferase [Thermoanaerobaculia bacterium]|jgi:16S rRNA (uracil1498-N3)-methyltransferase|nr:rRNA (uracil1498-N3)-methyltransferase [Thermoanaerobaculia bacterium]
MKHRFFIDADLSAGNTLALSHDEQHHAHVVRVRENEEVEVFNGRGASFVAKYTADGLQIIRAAPDREARMAIHLAMSIINPDKFDIVLQKATELGVRSIIPLVTDRVEIRAERYRGKAERWRKIVFEAVKQSGRSVIPIVEEPQPFDEIVKREGLKIVFDADSDNATQQLGDAATIFIGPEGGWSERELQLAREHGCAFESLGIRRLRAETAAIVATALVAARAGDI